MLLYQLLIPLLLLEEHLLHLRDGRPELAELLALLADLVRLVRGALDRLLEVAVELVEVLLDERVVRRDEPALLVAGRLPRLRWLPRGLQRRELRGPRLHGALPARGAEGLQQHGPGGLAVPEAL